MARDGRWFRGASTALIALIRLLSLQCDGFSRPKAFSVWNVDTERGLQEKGGQEMSMNKGERGHAYGYSIGGGLTLVLIILLLLILL